MRVRAKNFQPNDFSPKIAAFVGECQTFVTVGRDYDVHAMVLFDGILSLQIVDDLRFPAWYPSLFFDVIDRDLPADWRCNLFSQHGERGIIMLIGPDFVTQNEESYQNMVELDATQVDRFWKRVDSLQEEKKKKEKEDSIN